MYLLQRLHTVSAAPVQRDLGAIQLVRMPAVVPPQGAVVVEEAVGRWQPKPLGVGRSVAMAPMIVANLRLAADRIVHFVAAHVLTLVRGDGADGQYCNYCVGTDDMHVVIHLLHVIVSLCS